MDAAKKTHIKNSIEDTMKNTGAIGEDLKEKASEYLHEAQARLGEVGEKLGAVGKKIETQFKKNPVKTVVVGALVLAGVGYLLSRRR